MASSRPSKHTAPDSPLRPPSQPPSRLPPSSSPLTPRYSLFPELSSNPGNLARAKRSGKTESYPTGLGQARSMDNMHNTAHEQVGHRETLSRRMGVTPWRRQGSSITESAIIEDDDEEEDSFAAFVGESENLAQEIKAILESQSPPPPAPPRIVSPQSRRYGYAEPDSPADVVIEEKREARFRLVPPRTPLRGRLSRFVSADDLASKNIAEGAPLDIRGGATFSTPRRPYHTQLKIDASAGRQEKRRLDIEKATNPRTPHTPILNDPYSVPNSSLIPIGVAPFHLPSLRSLLRRSLPKPEATSDAPPVEGQTRGGILRETRIEVSRLYSERKESLPDKKDILRSVPVREDHTHKFNAAIEAGKTNILTSFNKDVVAPGAPKESGKWSFGKKRG